MKKFLVVHIPYGQVVIKTGVFAEDQLRIIFKMDMASVVLETNIEESAMPSSCNMNEFLEIATIGDYARFSKTLVFVCV